MGEEDPLTDHDVAMSARSLIDIINGAHQDEQKELSELLPETILGGAHIETIANGFRLQSTDEHVVEVWRYVFNWRLVSMLPHQQATTERGYCFFGTDLESLARAVAAGLAWENPLRSDPEGFDKRAF